MAAALSRVYAGLCRRDRLTSKECPFWLDSLFCARETGKLEIPPAQPRPQGLPRGGARAEEDPGKNGKYYFADLRMTFRQNFFLQDWFRNKLGVGLG